MLGALPPAFAGLDDDDALLVAAMLQPLSVDAGEVLMEAGEEDYTLAFITSGTVQLLDGEVRIGAAGARDMLGEVELFGQMPRVANAVASSPVQLQALSYDNWVQLCDSGSAVVHNVERFSHRRLGERLRWLNEAIAERSPGTAFELHPRGKGLLGRLSGFLGGGGGGRVSDVDRGSVLAASPLFDWAQPEIIQQIAESFTVERFESEQLLCKQGEVGDKVFLIAEGSVDVVVMIGNAKAETIATLRPGQAFGDASLATNAPRSASCVSHEPVVALTMGRDDYGALFALNDAGGSVFRQAMLKNLISQLLATQTRFVALDHIRSNTPDPTERNTPSSVVWRDCSPRAYAADRREQTMRAIIVVTWLALACGSTSEAPAPAPASAPAPAAKAPEPAKAAPAPLKPLELPQGHNPMLLDPKLATEQAPATYKVEFATSRGNFTVQVNRDWAPLAADRFYNLVKGDYYDGVRFFRAVRNFMVQFGISGYPTVNTAWREARFKDDPVKESNTRGKITFATSGPDSRTTQVFINLKDNGNLDGMGFAPFGEVVSGMDIVDQLYMDYGDGPPRGRGPNQGKLQQVGNVYLDQDFPKLDAVSEARIVE